MASLTRKRAKGVSYSKWGYIFIAPFFISFAIFTLYPLITTFYYSFFEMFRRGMSWHGPYPVGLDNYVSVIENGNLWRYFTNTLIMWLIGFIPQLLFSLLLAAWFTDMRLKLKVQGFFKTVIYLPNIIMAAAFSMLMFTLFGNNGPVNDTLISIGMIDEPIRFLTTPFGARSIIGFMNFLMWFGNTTILLMAAMMGIDPAMFEAAEIDGATPKMIFRKITLPLINPILIYVMITSMIGGLQMFDIPQILTNGSGGPDRTTMTMIMYLNQHLFSRNFGIAGAISIILFIGMGVLSLLVFKSVSETAQSSGPKKKGVR